MLPELPHKICRSRFRKDSSSCWESLLTASELCPRLFRLNRAPALWGPNTTRPWRWRWSVIPQDSGVQDQPRREQYHFLSKSSNAFKVIDAQAQVLATSMVAVPHCREHRRPAQFVIAAVSRRGHVLDPPTTKTFTCIPRCNGSIFFTYFAVDRAL